MKKLAVLMPTYNAAIYLNDSIDSILSQTFTNFDLYIYDDCSTDETQNIIESYTDVRIHYRKNTQNLGIAATLNKGINELVNQYDFIARMDADDWCYPNRFEKQIQFLIDNTTIDVLGTQGYWVRNFDENVFPAWKYPTSNTYIKYNLLFTATFGHSSVVFRNSFFSDVSMRYNEESKTCEDWELWTRISQVSEMANLSDFLLKYRIDPNSNHRLIKNKKMHFQERSKVISKHWETFNIKILPDEVFEFYYEESKCSAIVCIENLKKWILLFNMIFEKAKSEMTNAELQSFGYLLSRRILAYWKRSSTNRLNPTIWFLILNQVTFMNKFKLIKTLIK